MNRTLLHIVAALVIVAMFARVEHQIRQLQRQQQQDAQKPDGIYDPVVWSGVPPYKHGFEPKKPVFHNGAGQPTGGGWEWP